MKILNLTGERFGNLIAIEPAPRQSDKYTRWKCICDCGQETVVRTDFLRNGNTQSCGCLCGRTDIIGKKFGRLTVLEKLIGGFYLCLCDCGNTTKVKTGNLKNGNTQSCGCLQKERASETSLIDLTGQRFGKLIVDHRVANNRYNHVCYLCRCECGGEIVVDASGLRAGNTNSCGCIKSKGEMLINRWLVEHHINFIAQYSHEHIFLSSGRRPFFDFAIFNKKQELQCLLEYQGELHYDYTGYGWNTKENFENTVRRDNERRVACAKQGIPLYEIPHWELENIDKILGDIVMNITQAQETLEGEN